MNLIDLLEEKAAPYIRMLRIKHQAIGVIVYLLGLLDSNYFALPQILLVFVGLVTISMAGFLINDYYDSQDTDKFSYRKRVTIKSVVSSKVVLVIWFVLNSLGAILLTLCNLPLHALVFIIINTLYSAPPIRLKARVFGDLIVTFVQGAIAYTAGSALAGNGTLAAIFSVQFITLVFFFGAGEFILLTMDYEPDKLGGLKNTAVIFGYKWLIRISKVLLILAALAFAVLFYTHSSWWYYPLIAVLPYFGYAVGRLREGTESRKGLKSLLNISYTRLMTTLGLITTYLGIVFIYGLLRYYDLIPKLPW